LNAVVVCVYVCVCVCVHMHQEGISLRACVQGECVECVRDQGMCLNKCYLFHYVILLL